jgi:hypothetical protein
MAAAGAATKAATADRAVTAAGGPSHSRPHLAAPTPATVSTTAHEETADADAVTCKRRVPASACAAKAAAELC